MKLSKIQTPEQFLATFPTDIESNVMMRGKLHSFLATDEVAQKEYQEMCFAKPAIFFNTMAFTYDPRKSVGYQNIPFILRPKQIEAVDAIKDAIDNEHDLIIDKSRDEGATELICKMFVLYFWLTPESSFLVGSRKEEYVDNSVEIKDGRVIGSHKTLFHKMLYAISKFPLWTQLNETTISKKHKFAQNMLNGAMLNGEATNESFGAGDRALAVLIDEMARIEPDVAQCIIDSIRDVTHCCIYNSTHFRWGAGHPYAKLLRGNKIPTFVLGYEDNPEKNVGLYQSPKKDIVTIKDIEYYVQKYPHIFTDNMVEFNWSELQKKIDSSSDKILDEAKHLNFIADGGEGTWGRPRSVWFDGEEGRARSKMDIATNILRIPQGAADSFFDPDTIHQLRAKYIKEPNVYGEFKYDIVSNQIANIEFIYKSKKGLFKFWRNLIDGKLDTTHNYVVACDISRGTGASNSVLTIYDINTHEVIGMYASAYIDVSDFAELAIAVCKWLGEAYLIWEGNGPGDTFDNRIRKYSYSKLYVRRNERTITKKRSNFRGWSSTRGENGTKMDLLNRLDAALFESLKEEQFYPYIIIYDEPLTNELEDYMFTQGRMDAQASNSVDETTGAKYAHGDRVIATGLILVALAEARPADLKKERIPSKSSLEYRMRQAVQDKWEKEHTYIRERWAN